MMRLVSFERKDDHMPYIDSWIVFVLQQDHIVGRVRLPFDHACHIHVVVLCAVRRPDFLSGLPAQSLASICFAILHLIASSSATESKSFVFMQL